MRISRLLPIALVCLVGCGGPSLVGKWTMSGAGVPSGAKTTIEFTSDKFTQVMDMDQMGMKIHVDSSGTYTFDGKKLKMKVTDIKLDDSKLPDAVKSMAKTQMEAEKGKEQEADVKLEADTATLTAKGSTATLTKVK